MPQKKFKPLPTKQSKENLRKKVRDEIAKNPTKIMSLKKQEQPKKEYHKEFKRLMNIYSELSKNFSADTLDSVKLAKDELLHHLSLKLEKSYSYAFIYIRQLAITLRQTIAGQIKSSVYSVYNWQYLKNLELWTDYIVEHSKTNGLIRSLIQPIVQLIVGVLRLRPSARWLPIRFHCLKYLNQINYAYENITPVLANIIEVFNSINFNQKTKRGTKKTINLMVMLHFSTSQLDTFEHLEQSLDTIFQLIVENLAVYANHPAFPEYCVYLSSTIRSFNKKYQKSMFKKSFKSLMKKVDDHSLVVKKQRLRHPTLTKMNADPVFDKFIENYRKARLNELETIMKVTRHSKFVQPQDDYEDKEKNFSTEPIKEDDDGEESSDLDEDEFNDDGLDNDSAVEFEDD